PIIVPDATPVTTPRLSPFVCGVTVAMLCAGAKTMSTFACAGTAVGPAAMSGLGVGTGAGAGGAGVRHTSGNAVSTPIICVFANISLLLSDVNLLAVELGHLAGGDRRVVGRDLRGLLGAVVEVARSQPIDLLDEAVDPL